MLKLIFAFILMTSVSFGLSIDSNPTTLILADRYSQLDRPEGVAFTPSGDYIAVANSLANTITFYRRIGEQGSAYETRSRFSIKGPQSQLDYPHDLSFSPDGNHLAVANRQGNAITIYKKNLFRNYYDSTPIAVISGESSQIVSPDAVKYSPVENIIAVGNVDSNTISFYSYQGDQYDQQPYQVIQGSFFQVPDGLGFSGDGDLLGVISYASDTVVIYQRQPNSQGHYRDHPVQVLQGEETRFVYPHSLSFHPSENYLAVSCAQGRKNVHVFLQETEGAATTYSNAPILSLEILEMYNDSTIALLEQIQQDGGVKGIAFAPDGKSLAIVQNLCHGSLQFPLGVLAIYPVNIDRRL